MSGILGTSVIVRYLTGDPPDLANRAAAIIDTENDLRVTGVVLVQTAYVLTTVYRVPRDVAVDHLITFLQKNNIATPWARQRHGSPRTLAVQAFRPRFLLRRHGAGRRPIFWVSGNLLHRRALPRLGA